VGRHRKLTTRKNAALLEFEFADSDQFVRAVAFLAVIAIAVMGRLLG
jgi:hypothetical protein